MEIKKREFDFEQKETYSYDEVKSILAQNKKFVEGGFRNYLSPDEVETLVAEKVAANLTKSQEDFAKKAEHQKMVESAIPKNLGSKQRTAFLKLAEFGDDDTQEQISEKVSLIKKEHPYLFEEFLPNEPIQAPKEEPKKRYLFA